MQYIVRVRDAAGKEKVARVEAPSEETLRRALQKKELELIGFRRVEDEAEGDGESPRESAGHPEGQTAAAPAAAGKDGDWSVEGVEDALRRLEQLLQSAETHVHLLPISSFINTFVMPNPKLQVPALAVISRHALRQIVAGREPDEVYGFLLETCGLPVQLVRMLIGMTIDVGRICLGVSDGAFSTEEGVQYLLENAPGAEEAMVRPLIDRCLTLTADLEDRDEALRRVQQFGAKWG